MSARPLIHNPSNPVTTGIWRVAHQGGTAIRKVIGGGHPQRHPDWSTSHDPRRWNYWKREALFYGDDLLASAERTGLRAPRLLRASSLPSGEIELLLEDIAGRTGAALTLDDHAEAALRLGRLQGESALAPQRWERPWTSRGFLRDYAASKHVDAALLDDDEAWASPLCRAHWPETLRPALSRLYHRRDALLAAAASVPRTLGHLDFWTNNLIAAPSGEIVLVDWATVGDAALGEDVCNLIAEAVLDLYLPSALLPELDARLFGAYVAGLREAGWRGPEREVRRGFAASAVKFWWLGPLHLERARTGEHHLYGGRDDPDPGRQYSERGAVLAWLAALADEVL